MPSWCTQNISRIIDGQKIEEGSALKAVILSISNTTLIQNNKGTQMSVEPTKACSIET